MQFLPPKMKTYLVNEGIMFYVAFMPVQYDCNVVSDVRRSSSNLSMKTCFMFHKIMSMLVDCGICP